MYITFPFFKCIYLVFANDSVESNITYITWWLMYLSNSYTNWTISAVVSFLSTVGVQNAKSFMGLDLLSLQAIINFWHVSSAQMPPLVSSVCDTGCIILTNRQKCLCNLGVGKISPPAFCLMHSTLTLHKITKNIDTCNECAGVFALPRECLYPIL